MTPTAPDIGLWQLGLGIIFILVAGATSLAHGLKLGRDLAVGTLRTFGQLFLMGYVLVYVFKLQNLWLTLGMFVVMVAFAAHIILGRLKHQPVSLAWPLFFSMLASYLVVSLLVTSIIVDAVPWWRPEIFIPLSGMVVGNSMTALAVSLERLFSDLREKRSEIEAMLCLGADGGEASQNVTRRAMSAGMIPSINSMMGVGLVFIPGMMTGQILAGQDPQQAVRYQIVVMLMLVGSTAISALIMVRLAVRRVFGKALNLTTLNSTN